LTPSVICSDRCLAALNALDTLWPTIPSLLCRWHINKDVKNKIRSLGGKWAQIPLAQQDKGTPSDSEATLQCMSDFYKVCGLETIAEFEQRLQQFNEVYHEIASYMNKEWWPYKERFCSPWLNHITHFGELTTSRMEGSHSVFKKWISTGRGNILTLFRSTRTGWQSHAVTAAYDLAKSLNPTLDIAIEFFESCRDKIHRYPLQEVRKQCLDPAKEAIKQEKTRGTHGLGDCKGIYSKTLGMPCKHQILSILRDNDVLKPHQFHQHWWIDPSKHHEPFELVRREFITRETYRNRRISHRRGGGITSTQRQFTRSELSDITTNLSSLLPQQVLAPRPPMPPPATLQAPQWSQFTATPTGYHHQTQEAYHHYTQYSQYHQQPFSYHHPQASQQPQYHPQASQQQDCSQIAYETPTNHPPFSFNPARSWGWAGHRPFGAQ
jgi:hypothetical protein